MTTYQVTGIIDALTMIETPNTNIVDYEWEEIIVNETVETTDNRSNISDFDKARIIAEIQAMPMDVKRFYWREGPYLEMQQ